MNKTVITFVNALILFISAILIIISYVKDIPDNSFYIFSWHLTIGLAGLIINTILAFINGVLICCFD